MCPSPGDAGGQGADHQDPVDKTHLPGALQKQSQRSELQRDPEAAADGAAASGGDARPSCAVSGSWTEFMMENIKLFNIMRRNKPDPVSTSLKPTDGLSH